MKTTLLLLVLSASWPATTAEAPTCREQAAQDFLIRSSILKSKEGLAAALKRSIGYRIEKYGRLAAIRTQVVKTSFLDRPVTLHKKIVPALVCVAQAILRNCDTDAYRPRHLSGLRTKNTYRGGEISNHMFGIALDIDPDVNTCCGCVKPWSDHPKCRKRIHSVFERTEIPRCWVTQFERFGFYWLGWDEMQDTMHFEFLGDPDRVIVTQP